MDETAAAVINNQRIGQQQGGKRSDVGEKDDVFFQSLKVKS